MNRRTILHADMDAFYASIEQRDRPELRGLPVIVGATSPRGVVAAASYEARRFGVRSAMPGFRARQLCPDGVYLAPDLRRYGEVSEQVHRVFAEFTPEIEPLALDEAFLDITQSIALFGGAESLARRLKSRVREATGLTVSVGVGPNKLVAKIACRLGKPDGLRLVDEGGARALLEPLAVRQLWGVGPVLGERLEALGLRTLGQLARARPEDVAIAAQDRAESLIRLARGIDDRPVVSDRAPKSIGEENTFEEDVLDRDVIVPTLIAHAEAVARRLRRAQYLAGQVTLKAKLARARPARGGAGRVGEREPDYPLITRQRALARPSHEGSDLAALAIELWDAAALSEPVRLVGVSASALSPAAQEQLELFAPRRPPLGRTLDAIRERFGADAIHRAAASPGKVSPSLRKKLGE